MVTWSLHECAIHASASMVPGDVARATCNLGMARHISGHLLAVVVVSATDWRVRGVLVPTRGRTAPRAGRGSFPSHSGTDLPHGTHFLHRVSYRFSCLSQSPARGICGLRAGLGHYSVLPVAARSLTIPQGRCRGIRAGRSLALKWNYWRRAERRSALHATQSVSGNARYNRRATVAWATVSAERMAPKVWALSSRALSLIGGVFSFWMC